MVCWVLNLCQTSCCVFYLHPLCYRVLKESILSLFNSNYHYYDNYGCIHHLPSAYYMSDINLKTFSVFIITIPLSLISPNYCYSNSFLTTTALWAVGAVLLPPFKITPARWGGINLPKVIQSGLDFRFECRTSKSVFFPTHHVASPHSPWNGLGTTTPSVESCHICGFEKKASLFCPKFVIEMKMLD